MKNLPEKFSIPFLGSPIEVTQVNRIDPRLLDCEVQDEEGIPISGLFLAKSNEILICRNLSEVMKYIVFVRCLGEAAECALNYPNGNLVPEDYRHQCAITMLAGLVSAGVVEISTEEFQAFVREYVTFRA